jgi:hypothetical protein
MSWQVVDDDEPEARLRDFSRRAFERSSMIEVAPASST